MFMIVSRAIFFALVQHCIYAEAGQCALGCDEDRGKCAKLQNIMCITKVAEVWQNSAKELLKRLCFIAGCSSPVILSIARRCPRCVHGAGSVVSGVDMVAQSCGGELGIAMAIIADGEGFTE